MESFLIVIVGFVKIQIFTLLPCYFHLPFTLPTQINYIVFGKVYMEEEVKITDCILRGLRRRHTQTPRL